MSSTKKLSLCLLEALTSMAIALAMSGYLIFYGYSGTSSTLNLGSKNQ
jgi:hypothetical protein